MIYASESLLHAIALRAAACRHGSRMTSAVAARRMRNTRHPATHRCQKTPASGCARIADALSINSISAAADDLSISGARLSSRISGRQKSVKRLPDSQREYCHRFAPSKYAAALLSYPRGTKRCAAWSGCDDSNRRAELSQCNTCADRPRYYASRRQRVRATRRFSTGPAAVSAGLESDSRASRIACTQFVHISQIIYLAA
jgi:hypothetical protein